jgi:hypothetical protein
MSPVLEVLIGMIFTFSLLSILVTQINTVISQVLKLRAKHLRDGIGELISDEEIRARVITHPLIRLAEHSPVLPNQQLTEEQVNQIVNGAVQAVNYINPDTFVDVLLSVISVDADKELFGALLNTVDGMPAGESRRRLRLQINQIMDNGEGIPELKAMVAELEDETYKVALREAILEIEQEILQMGLKPDTNIALVAGVRQINNPYFREAMLTVLSTSQTLDNAKDKLKQWFNDGMDRVSDTFSRNLRWVSLSVGLLIAVVLNVDALYIARTLWNDPALRTGVAAVAASADLEALQEDLQAAEEAAASDETGIEEIAESAEEVRETLTLLLDLRLPLGWNGDDLSGNPNDPRIGDARYFWNFNPANYEHWLGLWILKIIGILGTAIATAQGAPFWFGILRQLSGGSTAK